MKCCESTDVGTWTNWLTFEPDPNYSPDAGTGLLCPISYKRARVRWILRRENPTYTYWRGLPLQRRVVLKWFYSLSRRNTFVGGTCATLSALCIFDSLEKTTWSKGVENDASGRQASQSIFGFVWPWHLRLPVATKRAFTVMCACQTWLKFVG